MRSGLFLQRKAVFHILTTQMQSSVSKVSDYKHPPQGLTKLYREADIPFFDLNYRIKLLQNTKQPNPNTASYLTPPSLTLPPIHISLRIVNPPPAARTPRDAISQSNRRLLIPRLNSTPWTEYSFVGISCQQFPRLYHPVAHHMNRLIPAIIATPSLHLGIAVAVMIHQHLPVLEPRAAPKLDHLSLRAGVAAKQVLLLLNLPHEMSRLCLGVFAAPFADVPVIVCVLFAAVT